MDHNALSNHATMQNIRLVAQRLSLFALWRRIAPRPSRNSSMRRSLVGAAASTAAASLSAWPKLCSKLLKSLTNRNIVDDDDDDDDLDGDDYDATTDVERLLHLRDVAAAPSVRSKALSSERTIELMNQRMSLFWVVWLS